MICSSLAHPPDRRKIHVDVHVGSYETFALFVWICNRRLQLRGRLYIFTNSADRATVASLYADSFAGAFGKAPALRYSYSV